MTPNLAFKRLRKAYMATPNGGTQMDRMSTLPDSVLCHIMSFLPTTTSVATMSRLSSRWRHLWKDLQVFRFNYRGTDCFKKFAFFVNSVLALRRLRHIQKFHFTYEFQEYNLEYEYVEMWVRAAIGPRLEELDLSIHCEYGIYIDLPPSLFMSCNNLVSLSLCGRYNMEVKHSLVQFPSLKKVYLSTMDSDSVVAFLSGCPKLEDLTVNYVDGISLAKAFSSSKRLKSTNDNFTWTYLDLGGYRLGIAGNFHTMVEAFLDLFSSCESEFVDPLLNDLQNDDSELPLESRHSTSKWPLQIPVINYPEFCNLDHLNFTLPCFNSNILVNVLEKCHELMVLIIHCHKEEPSSLRTWEPQSTTVPICLISHLKYICIEGYQGFEDELTFAEYILRNGLVLETMLIFVDISMDITNKYRSIKRLANIPRGSVTCQLSFDADGSS